MFPAFRGCHSVGVAAFFVCMYVNIDKDVLEAETYGKFVESNPDTASKAVEGFYQSMRDAGYIENVVRILLQ